MKHWIKQMMAPIGLVATVAYASPATADCETDEDCGAGRICVTHEYETPDCDVSMPDCEEGDEECLARIKEAMEDCESSEVITVSYCEPAPCETDADCGDDMVCVEYVNEWCSGSGDVVCDDDGECSEVEEEPECGSETIKECAYPYEAPCEQDADCGEGFDCVATEICSCSAGDDTPTDDGNAGDEDGEAPDVGDAPSDGDGEADDPEEPDCSCEPTGENHCELQEIDCTSDDDCPAGMICDSAGDSEPCEKPEGVEEDCPDVEPISRCRPEEWYRDDGVSAGDDMKGDGEENADPETETQTDNDGDDDLESDPPAPGAADVSPDNSDDDKEEKPSPKTSADSGGAGGCAVVAPAAGGSSAGALLALFGLLAVARRRPR
jgi:hypothetical protein